MSQKDRLLAFLIEGEPGGLPGFQHSIIFSASEAEWEEKIRQQAHCPDAEVKIIQPDEWDPPKLNEISQQELTNKFQSILDSIIGYLVINGIDIEPGELINGGTVVFNPVSGKVFFAYKY
jgi:hypothetical protein